MRGCFFPKDRCSHRGARPNYFRCDFYAIGKRGGYRILRSAALGGGSGFPVFPELECWLSNRNLMEGHGGSFGDLIHDAAATVPGELPGFEPSHRCGSARPFWMYVPQKSARVGPFVAFGRGVAAWGKRWLFPYRSLRDVGHSPRALFFRFHGLTGTNSAFANYDALGASSSSRICNQKDILVWEERHRLTVRWEALGEGIAGLRGKKFAPYYKLGADCSKMRLWLDAHDLISKYVPPNVGSRWQRGARVIDDESDVKRWISLVHDDEFPLGSFYVNLARRLGQAK
jgi:hypothetical protein